MGEAKRRKALDSNYGKVRKQTKAKLLPDFGTRLLQSPVKSGLTHIYLEPIADVSAHFYPEQKLANFHVNIDTASGPSCATFEVPCESDAEVERCISRFNQGVQGVVKPNPDRAFIADGSTKEKVIPVVFEDAASVFNL